MMKTIEQIAVDALHEISKIKHAAGDTARKALAEIEKARKPAVHDLAAAPLIVDKPPGGGP
jgi:hypothetical protein